jgi:hypothetical protein
MIEQKKIRKESKFRASQNKNYCVLASCCLMLKTYVELSMSSSKQNKKQKSTLIMPWKLHQFEFLAPPL